MNKNSTNVADLAQFRSAGSDGDFHIRVSAIERSKIAAADLSAAALGDVLKGVITGEGPTTAGRRHFSRTLDRGDAMLCERILMAGGGEAGVPVTRAEAEALFDIDAAGTERTDNGRFESLFVKSVAHCVLAEAGRSVPPRQVALAPQTPLSSWASRAADSDIDSEILVWIASHVHNKKRLESTLMGLSAIAAGIGAALSSAAPSIVNIIDMIS